MVDGILNINKPRGITSHDVVLRARRLFSSKIGHAGTLDPQATGVLLLLAGRATKIAQFIAGWTKEYLARMRFGLITSTQDVWGETLKEAEARDVTFGKIKETLPRFCGEITQTPPMVSALHHKGERLYRLARRGEKVEPRPRKVRVFDLELLEFNPGPNPELRFRVVTSGGTYIRTLCHDLGRALGVGGCLVSLARSRVGPYRLSSSIDLEKIEAMKAEARKNSFSSIDEALTNLPWIRLSNSGARRISQGQPIDSLWIEETQERIEPGSLIRLYDPSSNLLAIARTIADLDRPGVVAKPVRVLN